LSSWCLTSAMLRGGRGWLVGYCVV
jgi:hypothetical protein